MKINFVRIFFIIILSAGFVGVFGLGIWIGVTKISYHVEQPGTIDFSLFWDAYSKLQEKFIDPSKIDNQKVIYGAIGGMANSLGDPYTNFFDPEQAQRFQQNLSGSFGGIGVEIGIKKDALTIISPLKDGPGQRAGLKAGDVIAKIDGKDSIGIMIDEAVGLIRGVKGTAVTLTILRDGLTSAKDIKIIRETIKIPTVEWSLKNEDTAYIQISQFYQTLSPDFRDIALQILQSSAKKIVLDLRGNSGGYLEIAQDIAGWFLQKGQIVTIEDYGKNKPQQIYKTEGNAEFVNYPIVVLINQGTASAAEILAGALRDNRNVKLIGTKSFGKGCVQEPVNLPGGSLLKITVANWLTPKGSSISEVGLTPDVKVDITDNDIEQEKDPQLAKALEIINGLK
jgi:carboxyl-terminal processing protease